MVTATSVAPNVVYFTSTFYVRKAMELCPVAHVNGFGEADKVSTRGAAGETVTEVVGDVVAVGRVVVEGVPDVLSVLVGACEPFEERAAVAPGFEALDESVDWSDAAAPTGCLSSLPLASTATRTPARMTTMATRPPTSQRVRFD